MSSAEKKYWTRLDKLLMVILLAMFFHLKLVLNGKEQESIEHYRFLIFCISKESNGLWFLSIHYAALPRYQIDIPGLGQPEMPRSWEVAWDTSRQNDSYWILWWGILSHNSLGGLNDTWSVQDLLRDPKIGRSWLGKQQDLHLMYWSILIAKLIPNILHFATRKKQHSNSSRSTIIWANHNVFH